MHRVTSALLVAVMLCCVSGAEATTYYVQPAPTGDDARSCATAQTSTTPRRTIGQGIACLMGGGDTLLVRAGTYVEAVTYTTPSGTAWTAGNFVRIAAYPGETVWMQPPTGDGPMGIHGSAAYVEFDGINMRAVVSGAVFVFGVSTDTVHHIRLQNAEIVNESSPGGVGLVFGYGADSEFTNLLMHGEGGPYAFYIKGPRNLIDGNEMHHVNGACVQVYGGGPNTDANIVRNNICHDITHYDFSCCGGSANDGRRWGFVIYSGADNLVYHNVIYAVTAGSGNNRNGIQVGGGTIGTKVWGNTIADNDVRCIQLEAGATNTEIKNNICYQNTLNNGIEDNGTGTTTGTNLLSGDPLFVGAPDYHLTAGSPAIDTGTSLSASCTGLNLALCQDQDGVAQPQGTGWDIGAHEFGGVPNPEPPPPTTEPQTYRLRFRYTTP